MSSKLDQQQITQLSFDETNTAMKIRSVGGTFVPEPFDYIAVTYPLGTREVYTYKLGGASGTTVATLTVNYTDSSKAEVLNVART